MRRSSGASSEGSEPLPRSQREESNIDRTRPDRRAAQARDEFSAFVAAMEPRLRRALVGWCGVNDARDATAEALAWAWENWETASALENPGGYLYRVAQSKFRSAKQGHLPAPVQLGVPEVEPGLVPALQKLPDQQRTAIWLVHGCGWSYADCADAMRISASAVGTHVSRALTALREALEVDDVERR